MPSHDRSRPSSRIPEWLRVGLPANETFGRIRRLLQDLELNTVCQSARCPNIFDCFSRGVATFMILGTVCTRGCPFCNIGSGRPDPPDAGEPERIARACDLLGVSHIVLTSVTRDDLADGGASHFAAVVGTLRSRLPGLSVEVLIPDFQGDRQALATVLDTAPDILNHNMETVPGLYGTVRPRADYARSLELLIRAGERPGVRTKSGLMVGLGETDAQVKATLQDLAQAGCDIVTIGQYMRPSRHHLPVARYVHPDVFNTYAAWGRKLGIEHMHSAPLVRSSFHAARFVEGLKKGSGSRNE